MADEYTMEIDPQYPFGDYSQSSDAGSGQQADQGQQQGADGEQVQQPQQQPQGQQAQGQQPQGDQGQQDQQQVPVNVVQSIRQELQSLKQQNAYLQQMAMQPQQQPQGQQGPGQQNDPLADYEEDDVITVADMKKLMQQQMAQQPQQPQGQQPGQQPGQPQHPDMREMQMRSMYSDYDQIISQQLPTVLQQNPHLESAIRNSSNPYATAYTIAKQMGGQGAPQGQPQGSPNQAQQVVNNLQKPGTASQASGGGAISRAGFFAQMDDQTLEAEIAKAKRG